MREVGDVALDLPDTGGIRILTLRFAQLPVELAAQPAQPAPPALGIAADDRGVDDQLLPLPRRPQRAGDDHVVVLHTSRRWAAIFELLLRRLDAREAGDGIVCRQRGLGCARGLAGVRHLPERQVFGEPDCRQALDRARENGEKRPAPGVWAAGAALEPARNPGAIEGILEQADVISRAAQHHRDAIEAHPGARLLHDPAGNFDATRGPRRAPRTHALRRSARVAAAAGRRTGCGGVP